MQVQVADEAGFCAGVRRAVKIAEEAAGTGGKWYTLGPLVHNQSVVDYYRNKGICPINNIEGIKPGGLIIRAHGAPPEIIREAEQKGFKIKDASCPLVKRVHELVSILRGEGYSIVIFGDVHHPEVKGILGWCDNQATVVSSVHEADNLQMSGKIGIVSQTTKEEKNYYKAVTALLSGANEVRVFNTICPATRNRQSAARVLCHQVDVMLVVGDHSSSNTSTLVQECINTGVKTWRIQTAADIQPEWFRGVSRVGITAGASTPDWIIKEVMAEMTEFDENAPQEQAQEKTGNEELVMKEEPVTPPESMAGEEPAAEEGPAVQEESAPREESFAKMEAEMADFNTPSRGDVIKGIVIQVLDDEVMVDVGGKSEGIIPVKELSVKEINSAKELVQVGDEIEVLVLKWDDDGTILLSKKKVDAQRALDKLEEDFENGRVIEGTVVSSVKGGLLVDVGVVAFLPASHVEDGYVKNIEDYVGKTLQFKIIEFNRNKRRGSQIVLSRKQIVEEEKARLKEMFWENIEEGQTRQGRVKRIVDYGAFIDLGGYEGLLHVSEIDHVRIEHPSDVLHEGDEIEVYILALDRDKERVSLSRKKLLKSPWEIVLDKYHEGDIIEGTVVRIAPFGAFIEVEPGVDGLVHISQLADRRVDKPEDVVSVNEKVQVKILSIDPQEKRISLSIREAQKENGDQEVQEYLGKQDDSE